MKQKIKNCKKNNKNYSKNRKSNSKKSKKNNKTTKKYRGGNQRSVQFTVKPSQLYSGKFISSITTKNPGIDIDEALSTMIKSNNSTVKKNPYYTKTIVVDT
jgi:hypothetical protein